MTFSNDVIALREVMGGLVAARSRSRGGGENPWDRVDHMSSSPTVAPCDQALGQPFGATSAILPSRTKRSPNVITGRSSGIESDGGHSR